MQTWAGAQLFSADYYLYEHLRAMSRTEGSPLYPPAGALDAYERQSGLITADLLCFPTAAAAGKARIVLAGDAAADLNSLAATGGGSWQRRTFPRKRTRFPPPCGRRPPFCPEAS